MQNYCSNIELIYTIIQYMKTKKRKLIKIDLSGCKNMREINRIMKYFDEGKIKITVEDLKQK